MQDRLESQAVSAAPVYLEGQATRVQRALQILAVPIADVKYFSRENSCALGGPMKNLAIRLFACFQG
jgi:hypothetical protein